MDYKTIGITAIDAQLLDARKFSRIEICSMFGVPPHLIGETEKTATYASVEQFNIMFATQCILPRIVLWEQAIQRDLIMDDRYFAKFSMAAILRGDTAARYAAYRIGVQNGWLSQDDIRELEDLNPIADGIGKSYWRPLNWARLDQEPAEQQQPNKQGGAGQQIDDTEDPEAGAAAGTTTVPPAATEEHVKLLAGMAADPCVRKEVNGVRRLIGKWAVGDLAGQAALEEFYRAHAEFLMERLRIPAAAAKKYCEHNLAGIKETAIDISDIERHGAGWLGAIIVEVTK
jgi:hypothetical protein